MDGISKKIYLELQAPTEDDNRSDQRRIQDGLKEQGIEAKVSLRVLVMFFLKWGLPLARDLTTTLPSSGHPRGVT